MKYDYHVFVCANQKAEGKKCCGEKFGLDAVKILRDKIKNHDSASRIRIQRAGCLDVCGNGPAMVVYPDGCFYGNLNEESLEKIAESHLLGNQSLSEFMIPEKD